MAETASLHSRIAVPSRVADIMQKPQLDKRTYRVIKLANNLEALLIHDSETDKASAAMDVDVGSFSDSDELPGMAHAVEHLLFMGTEKVGPEAAFKKLMPSDATVKEGAVKVSRGLTKKGPCWRKVVQLTLTHSFGEH